MVRSSYGRSTQRVRARLHVAVYQMVMASHTAALLQSCTGIQRCGGWPWLGLARGGREKAEHRNAKRRCYKASTASRYACPSLPQMM